MRSLLIAVVAVLLVSLLPHAPLSAQSEGRSMGRLNKIVKLLAEGKPVFGMFSGDKTARGGMAIAEKEVADFVFYSMESGPFDVEGMQVYMQFMLSRAELARSTFNGHPVALRIPPIRDGWVEAQDRTKRGLDAGVYSIVYPHVESAEEALHAVRSMRFRDAKARGPEGLRPSDVGDSPRYWGLSADDYRSKADLWPLNPEGELVNILLIEDRVGVKNAREIVSTEGVSIVIPGPGDLRRAYNNDAAAIENAIQTVLAACKEFDVPCGITAGPDNIEQRLKEGFRVFIAPEDAIAVGRRAAGR